MIETSTPPAIEGNPFEQVTRNVFAGLMGLLDFGLIARRPEWREVVAKGLRAGVLRLEVTGMACDAGTALHVAAVESATGRELFGVELPSVALFGGREPGQALDS